MFSRKNIILLDVHKHPNRRWIALVPDRDESLNLKQSRFLLPQKRLALIDRRRFSTFLSILKTGKIIGTPLKVLIKRLNWNSSGQAMITISLPKHSDLFASFKAQSLFAQNFWQSAIYRWGDHPAKFESLLFQFKVCKLLLSNLFPIYTFNIEQLEPFEIERRLLQYNSDLQIFVHNPNAAQLQVPDAFNFVFEPVALDDVDSPQTRTHRWSRKTFASLRRMHGHNIVSKV